MTTLGARLKELRKSRSYTGLELSRILNVTVPTISMWESDKRKPSSDMLKQISNVFNVSIDYLLTGEKLNPTSKEPTSKDMDSIIDDIDIYYYGGDKNMTEEQRKQLKRIIAATLNEDNK